MTERAEWGRLDVIETDSGLVYRGNVRFPGLQREALMHSPFGPGRTLTTTEFLIREDLTDLVTNLSPVEESGRWFVAHAEPPDRQRGSLLAGLGWWLLEFLFLRDWRMIRWGQS